MDAVSDSVLRFIAALAWAQKAFHEMELGMRRLGCFSKVTLTLMPTTPLTDHDSSYCEQGVTLWIAVSGDLVQVRHHDRRTVEAMVLMRACGGQWIADGSIAWSGRDIGHDVIHDICVSEWSLDALSDKLPGLARDVLALMDSEVALIASDQHA